MDNYKTDKWILEIFKDWYDPCPCSEIFITDGLLTSWKDRTYVNPPYSNPLPWVLKAIEESKKGFTIAMLLKMDTSTKWFKELQEAGAMFMWINGRLKHQTGKACTFPSMIAIIQEKAK